MFDRVLSLRLKFTVMDIPALLNYFGTAPSKHATGDLLVGFFITRIGKLLWGSKYHYRNKISFWGRCSCVFIAAFEQVFAHRKKKLDVRIDF